MSEIVELAKQIINDLDNFSNHQIMCAQLANLQRCIDQQGRYVSIEELGLIIDVCKKGHKKVLKEIYGLLCVVCADMKLVYDVIDTIPGNTIGSHMVVHATIADEHKYVYCEMINYMLNHYRKLIAKRKQSKDNVWYNMFYSYVPKNVADVFVKNFPISDLEIPAIWSLPLDALLVALRYGKLSAVS